MWLVSNTSSVKMLSKQALVFIIPVICLNNAKHILPSSPEVFYGGFKPILTRDNFASETRSILPTERISHSLPKLSKSKLKYLKYGKKKSEKSEHRRKSKNLPFHKDSKPTFPLCKIDSENQCQFLQTNLFQIFLTSTDSLWRMQSLETLEWHQF